MSKDKKVIAIPGHIMNDSGSIFGIGTTYAEFIRSLGAVPRILSTEEAFTDEIDMLLVPGGPDINPKHYNEAPSYRVRSTDVHNDWFFSERLPEYIKAKMPIFGICLGFQALQVAFGGKLIQDLIVHPESENRGEVAHTVWDVKHIDKKGVHLNWEVNSHHHQGVKYPADCFEIDAIYSALKEESIFRDDKYRYQVVEAMHHKDLPIAGVQWHPEELSDYDMKVHGWVIGDPWTRNMISSLLNAK